MSRKIIHKERWERDGENAIRYWANGDTTTYTRDSLKKTLRNLHESRERENEKNRAFWDARIAIFDEGMALFSSRKVIKWAKKD
jgi:hypothetical protein